MRDSTQITTTFSYTPPAFLQSKKEQVQRGPEPEYDVARFTNSSKKIMCLEEVMSEFGVKRGAIINWRKTRGFPEPISKNPMRFLRSAIEEWKEHTGGVKAPN